MSEKEERRQARMTEDRQRAREMFPKRDASGKGGWGRLRQYHLEALRERMPPPRQLSHGCNDLLVLENLQRKKQSRIRIATKI